jgi:hypothetical protein
MSERYARKRLRYMASQEITRSYRRSSSFLVRSSILSTGTFMVANIVYA